MLISQLTRPDIDAARWPWICPESLSPHIAGPLELDDKTHGHEVSDTYGDWTKSQPAHPASSASHFKDTNQANFTRHFTVLVAVECVEDVLRSALAFPANPNRAIDPP